MSEVDVFPAPAGINRLYSFNVDFAVGVPRTCGDKPSPPSAGFFVSVCSPHLRG